MSCFVLCHAQVYEYVGECVYVADYARVQVRVCAHAEMIVTPGTHITKHAQLLFTNAQVHTYTPVESEETVSRVTRKQLNELRKRVLSVTN